MNCSEMTRRQRVKVVAGISLGNAMEYFDLTLYTFFAIYIGRLIFPEHDPSIQLMFSFAIYGVGYIARPFGGIILGRYADKYGRKKGINLTLMLMAVGTCLIGLAPTYAMVGIWSPIAVVVGRLLQGFSAGGETGASTTLLAEMAPRKQRGFYVSWQGASQGLAVAAAASLAWVLSLSMDPGDLAAWGWRIPFIAGVLIVPVGFYLRKNLEDTAADLHASDSTEARPQATLLSKWREALIGLLLLLGANSAYTIVNLYMPTYGVKELGLSPAISSGAALLGGLLMFSISPLAGKLTDRYGRKTILIISRSLMIVSIYPAFLAINASPTAMTLLICIAYLSILNALGIAPLLAALTELFPRHMRVTGMATVYSVAVTISGGFGQFIVTALIEFTKDPISPAYYVIGIGIVSFAAVLMFRDRSHDDLDADSIESGLVTVQAAQTASLAK
jgi:MFS transporter, MHS family, proline/betaine transporter